MSRFQSDRIEPKGPTFEEEFNALSQWLERDTQLSSRSKDSTEHLAFKEITGYGRKAIPLLINRIKSDDCRWWHFGAISTIIGTAPIIPDRWRGVFAEIRAIYISWADDGFPEPWVIK